MKYTLSVVILIMMNLHVIGQQNNLYQLSFAGLDKDQINMNDYKGKKIMVVECDAAKSDKQLLFFLDSLYRIRKQNLVIIAIPVDDFEQAPAEKDLKKLWRDTLKLSFIITKISRAKKGDAVQHKLLNWLTNKNQNTHFEETIDKDGQIFIIGETGRLFACIKNRLDFTNDLMNVLLNQQVQDN